MIGESILPTGFVPVTAVPTVIRFGPVRRARIRTADGAWQEIALRDLEQYVSEEHNPENVKGVAGAEVFVPSPLLATGMCLVDTPGLGIGLFRQHRHHAGVHSPHRRRLVVTGSDPPLAGEELELVESVAKHVVHLIVVLNKADKATEAEKAAAIAFTQRLLQKRLQRPAEAGSSRSAPPSSLKNAALCATGESCCTPSTSWCGAPGATSFRLPASAAFCALAKSC